MGRSSKRKQKGTKKEKGKKNGSNVGRRGGLVIADGNGDLLETAKKLTLNTDLSEKGPTGILEYSPSGLI